MCVCTRVCVSLGTDEFFSRLKKKEEASNLLYTEIRTEMNYQVCHSLPKIL